MKRVSCKKQCQTQGWHHLKYKTGISVSHPPNNGCALVTAKGRPWSPPKFTNKITSLNALSNSNGYSHCTWMGQEQDKSREWDQWVLPHYKCSDWCETGTGTRTHCFLLDFVLNGVEPSMNSANSGNLINHWNMNWIQFKDPVCYMYLAGTVVASRSLT